MNKPLEQHLQMLLLHPNGPLLLDQRPGEELAEDGLIHQQGVKVK